MNSKKRQLSKLILLLFLSVFARSGIHAQVTIGSGIEPNPGALLDLKEDDQEEQNATRGLNLPRVELESVNSLAPCLAAAPAEPKAYKGLTVYNITDALTNKGKGVYIWDGGEWVYTPGKRNRSQISN